MPLYLLIFICSLTANLITHRNLPVAISNSLILSLSIIFYRRFINRKISVLNWWLILSLAVIPLFNYNPQNTVISLTPLVILLFSLLSTQKKFPKLFLGLGVFFLLLGNLIAGGLLSLPFHINLERSIFSFTYLHEAVVQHQRQITLIPFGLKTILFNPLVYGYFILMRIADSLPIQAFYETLLFANIYPLFIGILILLKSNIVNKGFIYCGLVACLIALGINISPDRFNTFLLASPFLVFLILLGFEKVNKKVYLLLLLLSIIITTSPKI